MSDREPSRVRQKIREIDETPLRWRVAGILLVGLALYNVSFGAPTWYWITPPVTLYEILGVYFGLIAPLLVLFSWFFGIYFGHQMFKITRGGAI